MKISVCPIYTLLDGIAPSETPNVVIDTLRMTSVAATALSNGCRRLRVVSEPEDAMALAKEYNALLGGERGAVKIPDFDLSNSPLEFTPERVGGRSLIMTTTNGTRAILAACAVGSVRLGCLLNARAVAESLKGSEGARFVLAGTNGLFSLEDAMTAGAIIERMGGLDNDLDDMALASLRLYESAKADLHAALSPVMHYRRLQKLGFQGDLDLCLSEDRLTTVPMLGEDGWFC